MEEWSRTTKEVYYNKDVQSRWKVGISGKKKLNKHANKLAYT